MKAANIDIETLLKPISKKYPCGKSVILDENFLQIKRERTIPDNRSLGVWKSSEIREINWIKIEKLAIEILTLKSKDLMVCSLLLESRFHLYGLLGLADSILLILSLSKKFWNNIFPELDDDGSRENPFLWLAEKIPFFLKTIPLFEFSPSNNNLTYYDIEQFIFKKDISENLNFLFSLSGTEDLNIIINETNKCIYVMNELNEFLTESIFPNDKMLNKSLEIINIFSNIFQSVTQSHQLKEVETSKENFDSEKPSLPRNQNLETNRSDIYLELKRLSEMLLVIEPHSPVPLLILRSLRWESKSFIEIIFDIMKNSTERDGIMALFGKEDEQVENNFGD